MVISWWLNKYDQSSEQTLFELESVYKEAPVKAEQILNAIKEERTNVTDFIDCFYARIECGNGFYAFQLMPLREQIENIIVLCRVHEKTDIETSSLILEYLKLVKNFKMDNYGWSYESNSTIIKERIIIYRFIKSWYLSKTNNHYLLNHKL